MHPNAQYWERGIDHVPDVTGARTLLDGADIKELAQKFGLKLPLKDVLDVGCGTGRAAQHCSGYLGVDISRDSVAYCAREGVKAELIDGATDLPKQAFKLVLCLSVFTHVDRAERQRYLSAFASRSRTLLVDVVIGDGTGEVALWTADETEFARDLEDAGYTVATTAERRDPVGGHLHRYYLAERT